MINPLIARFCGTGAALADSRVDDDDPDSFPDAPPVRVMRGRGGNIQWTPEMDAMVRRLAATRSLNQIARYMHMSFSSVQSYCKRHGIKIKQSPKTRKDLLAKREEMEA